MSLFDERDAYKDNPYFKKPIYGDFTPFYITITICTIIGFTLFLINIVLGCCSRYSRYWNDPHTGNRWIVSLWTSTPHQQPPVDLSEIELIEIPQQTVVYTPELPQSERLEYSELQKRESDI